MRLKSHISSYNKKVINLQHAINYHQTEQIYNSVVADIVREMNLNFRDSFEAYTHDNVDAEIQEYYIPYMDKLGL